MHVNETRDTLRHQFLSPNIFSTQRQRRNESIQELLAFLLPLILLLHSCIKKPSRTLSGPCLWLSRLALNHVRVIDLCPDLVISRLTHLWIHSLHVPVSLLLLLRHGKRHVLLTQSHEGMLSVMCGTLSVLIEVHVFFEVGKTFLLCWAKAIQVVLRFHVETTAKVIWISLSLVRRGWHSSV